MLRDVVYSEFFFEKPLFVLHDQTSNATGVA